MSDLVKRLRDYATNLGGPPEDYLTWQAAARIEALEKVLRQYSTHTSDCGWCYGHDCDCGIVEIRTTLAPEQDK